MGKRNKTTTKKVWEKMNKEKCEKKKQNNKEKTEKREKNDKEKFGKK